MMAVNLGAGEDTSTQSWHREGSREMFLGDFEVNPSGWGEGRVSKAFSSSELWPLLWTLRSFGSRAAEESPEALCLVDVSLWRGEQGLHETRSWLAAGGCSDCSRS